MLNILDRIINYTHYACMLEIYFFNDDSNVFIFFFAYSYVKSDDFFRYLLVFKGLKF